MRRPPAGWLACTLAAAGILMASPGPARAANSPLAGNWKVVVLSGGNELAVWLVEIETKGLKPKASLLSTGLKSFQNSKLTKFTADDRTVRFHFKVSSRRGGAVDFDVVAYLPKGEKAPKHLLGSVGYGNREFARLDRTKDDELDPTKAVKKGPAADALQALGKIDPEDQREQIIALKKILKNHPEDPAAYIVNWHLLRILANKKKSTEKELRPFANGALKLAAPYGREMTLYTNILMANQFAEKWQEVALSYLKKAQRLLAASDTPAEKVAVLKPLARLLRKTGKDQEAKTVSQQVAKLDDLIDKEFLKTAIPFKPEAFKGRTKKSDRVVVVELFTGAQCGPCVPADIAFDALLKTFQAKDVVLLQYHLHIPRPDVLTNKDSLMRAKFYEAESTPSVFVNGDNGPGLGGPRQAARLSYDKLRKAVEEDLEKDPQAGLKLTVKRQGETVDVSATVSGLKKTGEDVQLRFVLVEDVVRYLGSNGQRLHHHVVRAVRGGGEDFALEKKTATKAVKFDLKALRKTLDKYLVGFKDPLTQKKPFADDDRPLDLKHLKVVAFIQDNKSKEILAAAQADVPGGKEKDKSDS
jgi:hypothetical protein